MASDLSAKALPPRPPPPPPPPPAAKPAAPAAPAKPAGSPPASVGPTAAEKQNPALLAQRGLSGFDPAKPAGPLSLTGSFEAKTKVENGPLSAEASAKVSLGVDSKTEVSAGADGPKAMDKTAVSVREQQAVSANLGIGKLGVNANFGSGSELKAEIATPAGGPGDADPRDPDAMPVGSKVTFTASANQFEGSGVSLSQKLGKGFSASVGLSDSVTRTSGVTFSAQKVDDHTMRVTQGGVDSVSDAFGGNAKVSVGKGSLSASLGLGLQSTNAETEQHLQTRDFDLQNPAGRQAYFDLVGGRAGLPAADPSKGIGAGRVDQYSVSQETSASVEAKLGKLGIQPGKIPVSSSEGRAVLTRAADGSAKVSHSLRFDNQSFSVDRTFGADGVEDVSKRRFNFLLTGADPGVAENFPTIARARDNRVATGMVKGDRTDLQLSFTQAQLQDLQALAKTHPGAENGRAFIRDIAHVDVQDLREVFKIFDRRNVTDGLSALGGGTMKPIPGQIFIRSPDNGMTLQLR